MFKRNGFAPIIILLILAAAVALGVGGYAALRKRHATSDKGQGQQQPTAQATTIAQTADQTGQATSAIVRQIEGNLLIYVPGVTSSQGLEKGGFEVNI